MHVAFRHATYRGMVSDAIAMLISVSNGAQNRGSGLSKMLPKRTIPSLRALGENEQHAGNARVRNDSTYGS